MISLCMIVKDEKENIERCLTGLPDWIGEIVVVDTGSTDGTKAAARKLGAKVYDFLWSNDFSAARNFSLEKAAGDWILWLDADEELYVKQEGTAFFRQLDQAVYDIYPIEMLHYYGQAPVEEQRSYRSAAHRLFRNHVGIVFAGKIHENLFFEEEKIRRCQKPVPGALLRHYGYLEAEVSRKKKAERNLSLLEQEDISLPWVRYHLASERYRLGEIEEALSGANNAVKAFLKEGRIPPAIVYKLKYEILLQFGACENTLRGLTLAERLYPDYVDLKFYKGLTLMRMKQWREAADCFIRCLELGVSHLDYLVLSGAGSYFAQYYLGQCYEQAGNGPKACEAYREAVKLYPGFEQALERLEPLCAGE